MSMDTFRICGQVNTTALTLTFRLDNVNRFLPFYLWSQDCRIIISFITLSHARIILSHIDNLFTILMLIRDPTFSLCTFVTVFIVSCLFIFITLILIFVFFQRLLFLCWSFVLFFEFWNFIRKHICFRKEVVITRIFKFTLHLHEILSQFVFMSNNINSRPLWYSLIRLDSI